MEVELHMQHMKPSPMSLLGLQTILLAGNARVSIIECVLRLLNEGQDGVHAVLHVQKQRPGPH